MNINKIPSPSGLMPSSSHHLIPKIIHYCWFGPKQYSRTVRKCIATWHKHLSDYEFRLWNEETCAAYAVSNGLPNPMEHPFVKGAYAAKKYAFVADYVRFWTLYHCGGIYLDTDMYVVKNFDNLLDATFFTAWEIPNESHDSKDERFVSCGVIGACAFEICAQNILDKYDTLVFDDSQLDKFIVPRIITPIVLQHPAATIYPYDYFYAFPFAKRMEKNFMKYKSNNSYALHLWDISWYPWYKKAIRQLVIELKKIRHA